MRGPGVIIVLTNADTEILALRAVVEGLPDGFPGVRAANPDRLGGPPELDGIGAVVVRLLGGRRAWQESFDALRHACIDRSVPLIALGGEAVPDAEMEAASTVDAATVRRSFGYFTQGGLENIENLLRFVSDSVLGTAFGASDPAPVPPCGVLGTPDHDPSRPTVGVVFYRAHVLSGNTSFVTDLCAAIESRGVNALPVFCYSLRPPADHVSQIGDATGRVPAVALLAEQGVDAVVTTVLAAGSAAGEGADWDAGALAALDVPIVQAVAATTSWDEWTEATGGLSPIDVAMTVAIPELDGRIVSVPFSFKETVDDGEGLGSPVTAYRTQHDRVERVAGIVTRLARLRRTPVHERRVALVLSAYPTKRSRIGNAVGLDTPASVIGLLHALAGAGYRVERVPDDGDALMSELADALTYDRDWMTPPQVSAASGRWPADRAQATFAELAPERREEMQAAWGPPPGTVYTDGEACDLVFPGIDLGGVLVTVQPPRGFGENPVAVYHSPDLAPTHHYLGFYRWLDEGWGADAVVHVGKHGTLEWLPGKSVGLSGSCWPDAALGDLPLVYPFVVNDPGEGTQAKRRAHAVIVDHLVPPLTRADTYDDLARLEGLLDTYAQVAALDPSKLPSLRRQVWDLLVQAEIHRDLGLSGPPGGDGFDDPAFDDLLVDVDGYLCELKDAQIRGGLHTLGEAPCGEAELDLVLALTRLPQGKVPSLRESVAARLGISATTTERGKMDLLHRECRALLQPLQANGWRSEGLEDPTLAWVCDRLVPALRQTGDEIGSVLAALDGRHVRSGPSGAPSRGMAHVLPTGRNFYSIDPRAVPSPLAWEVGCRLAESVLERHLAETGRYPASVGLVVWGTSAMRTAGDDIAEALALLGVRPVWAEESGRVEGLEVVPIEVLARPRVDVTLRVSGFFRDAFPSVIALVDEAVEMVAGLEEAPADNPVRARGAEDPRIYGPRPGAYGSGVLALLESRDWKDDEDLAAVYLEWGGWSYGRGAMGAPAPDAWRRRLAGIEIAVKNQDNREHDIFDSDDYLQDHGGMVATIRALTGTQPRAFFGDSSDPSRPRVRSLAEEAARVVRSRVINPKWIDAMKRHGYKGAFEMAATVDYLFGYDATARVVEDWMYERVAQAYVADPEVRAFFARSNPWALRSIAERLLEADERGLWSASDAARAELRSALLEAEGWEEDR